MEMEFGESGAQKSGSTESRDQNKMSDTSIQPTGDATIDGLGQMKRIIQNKIRNLEKKKAKLETYKELLKSGKELTEDQKAAVEKVEETERSIETQKDFLKIIQTVQNDYCKQLKTHKKKEEREKQQIDINRFRDLLRYQDVLNTLGNDEVRQDFLDGAKASVKCSKEDMALYDDMYKKLCPASEDATDWAKALDESALFAYRLVTGAPKTATGFESVTFQQLKETLDNIATCPYFRGKSTQNGIPFKQAEATVEIKNGSNNVATAEINNQLQ